MNRNIGLKVIERAARNPGFISMNGLPQTFLENELENQEFEKAVLKRSGDEEREFVNTFAHPHSPSLVSFEGPVCSSA